MRIPPKTLIMLVIALPIAVVFGGYLGHSMPGMTLLLVLGLMAFCIYIIVSNKSGRAVTGAQFDDAAAFVPTPGKARIYVMRTGFMGGMQGMNITIDTSHNGQIRSNYFMMAEVEPGTHRVTARMKNKLSKAVEEHFVTLAADSSVLVEVGLEMGMTSATPYFTDYTERAQAIPRLRRLKMVDWLP
mgnify:CR=1 FL=1